MRLPTFDPGDLTSLEGRCTAVFRLAALMAFPGDEAQEREYLVARCAKALAESPNADGIRALFDAAGGLGGVAEARPLSVLFETVDKSVDGWFVASLMMSLLVRLANDDEVVPEQASVNKAAYLLEAQRPQFKNPEALAALPRNRNDIIMVWSRFRHVAHLCSAFINWSIQSEKFSDLVFQDLGVVLSTAMTFQQWGLAFVPRRSQKAILDRKRLWRLPDSIRPSPIALAPLTSGEIELLRAYRAPTPSH